jgi:thioredoxin-like negative regulator of GroEL
VWRETIERARGEDPESAQRGGQPRRLGLPPLADPGEEWLEETENRAARPVRKAKQPAPAPRAARPSLGPGRRKIPRAVVDELTESVGPARAGKLTDRLAEAGRAYERERYEDARRVLQQLVEVAPAAGAVQELYGLTLYRQGKWAAALRHLEASHGLTGSYDQHPVMADCARALGRYRRVTELWDELRQASPGAELTTEGRIVMAGALADQGDVRGAIRLLESTRGNSRRPRPHHLRLWYALADLYERAGDVPRARELFGRVAAVEPDAFDVPERLRALR